MITPTTADRRARAYDRRRLDAHPGIPRRTDIQPRASYLRGYEDALAIYSRPR